MSYAKVFHKRKKELKEWTSVPMQWVLQCLPEKREEREKNK
jgi:hypothetical protein